MTCSRMSRSVTAVHRTLYTCYLHHCTGKNALHATQSALKVQSSLVYVLRAALEREHEYSGTSLNGLPFMRKPLYSGLFTQHGMHPVRNLYVSRSLQRKPPNSVQRTKLHNPFGSSNTIMHFIMRTTTTKNRSATSKWLLWHVQHIFDFHRVCKYTVLQFHNQRLGLLSSQLSQQILC